MRDNGYDRRGDAGRYVVQQGWMEGIDVVWCGWVADKDSSGDVGLTRMPEVDTQ